MPGLERVAPAVALREVADPRTVAAVLARVSAAAEMGNGVTHEVEVVRGGLDEIVTGFSNTLGVGGVNPDDDKGRWVQVDLLLEKHLCEK